MAHRVKNHQIEARDLRLQLRNGLGAAEQGARA
jgi:hypothetical protein